MADQGLDNRALPARRILAVDPGDRRIGLAVSDPSGTIARPLTVITHVSRAVDAALIADIARGEGAILILVGQALDQEGRPGPAARKAARLAEAIRSQADVPVELWDESGSTNAARQALLEMGVPRSRRGGHQDAFAASLILRDYLDAHGGGA